MTTATSELKSCGPQLLDASPPDTGWSLDELTAYVEQLHAEIITEERTLAPAYWCLGQALSLVRKQEAAGTGGRYLKTLGIEKTRSSKACAIFRRFSSPAELDNLSVDEAYDLRHRRAQKRNPDDSSGPSSAAVDFARALAATEPVGMSALDLSAQLSVAEKRELIKQLRATIGQLQAMERELSRQMSCELGEDTR